MFLRNIVVVAATLFSSADALFYWNPEYRCALDDSCISTKRDAPQPDLTFPIVQRVPENPQPHDVRIRQLASRLKRKYQGSLATPVEDLHNGVKRANTHSVVSASIPTQTNSAALDQDGTDYSYFAQVLLGSESTPVYLLMDTGAGNTWVMGASCTSDPCKSHDTFDPSNSKTFKDLGTTFSVNYGSGNVNGTMGQDTLSIAGMKLTMAFAIASAVSQEFNSFPIDGILGLSLQKSNTPLFWATLAASKALKANVACFALSRSSDGPNNGVVNFGAPDTSRFTGSLTYFPVAINSYNNWAVTLSDIGIGSTKAGITGRTAYIDTGTSFIFGPPSDVATLHGKISGAKSGDKSTYTVPCTTTDPITLTFGTTTYSISSKDWVSPPVNGVCTSNIYGVAVVDDISWLIGDTFLKNVYAVFDYDQLRMGFAQNGPVAAASSLSSVASSTSGGSTTQTTSVTPGAGSPTSGSQSNGLATGSGSSASQSATISSTVTSSSSSSTGIANSQGLNGHETPSTTGVASAESGTAAANAASATPTADKKGDATSFGFSFISALVAGSALVGLLI